MNIKRILVSLSLILALSAGLIAQSTGVTDSTAIISPNGYHIAMPSMRSTGSSQWYTVAQYGVYSHVLVVSINGTLSALTIVLEGSNDQVTVTTIGTSTDAAGGRITGDGAYNYIRARISSYTGTGRVTPAWTGFPTTATSGGGGGGGGGDVNLTQINSNTVNTGVGASASGTQRVVLSTDSTIANITSGTKTNNGQAPGATNLGVLPVVANAVAPTYTEGNQAALSTDLGGLLRVAVVSGGGTGGTSSSFGAGFPAIGTPSGFSDGSLMRPGLAVDADTSGGTQYVQRVQLGVSGSGGSVEVGTAASPLRTDPTGTTNQPVVGNKTNNAAAPGTNNVGVLPCLANAATPTFTEGNLVNCSVTLGGAERVVGTGTAGTANAGVLTVQGIASMTPVQVSQATAANLNATIVGTKSNNAVVPGSTNLGVLPAVATTAAPTYTDTDQVGLSTDLAGALRVNVVSGSTGNAASSATGSPVPAQADYTGINVAGTLRGQTGTNTSGSVYAADVNIVAAPTITYNATQPTKTDGQTVPDFQITSRGALIVNPGVESFPVTLAANQSVNVAQINGVTPLMGAGNTGTGSPRVTIATDQANLPVISGTAPVVTMNSASANAGVTSPIAGVFDDTAPTTLTENNFGFVRMSSNRNLYGTIRDAAGNERGANVNSSNELLTAIGTPANIGVYAEDAATVNGGNLMKVGSVRRDTSVTSATSDGQNAVINTDANGLLWTRSIQPCSARRNIVVPVSSTTDVVLVTATASVRTYICGGMLNATAAEIFNIWEGTGSTCGTGSAALIGSTTEASGPSFAANGGFTINAPLSTASTNVDVCLRISGSNRVAGYITYVQE